MAVQPVRLIVGLGNPGDSYRQTRHNIGFQVVEALAAAYSIAVERHGALQDVAYGSGWIHGVEAAVAEPLAFMNRSGPPIRALLEFTGMTCGEILVVHDDIDLVFGRLKIKKKGGYGGHKGILSLIGALGGGDFPRLRLGVGRPAAGISVSEHVLRPFAPEEHHRLEAFIAAACDAVRVVLTMGLEEGMNRFNQKKEAFSIRSNGGSKWNS